MPAGRWRNDLHRSVAFNMRTVRGMERATNNPTTPSFAESLPLVRASDEEHPIPGCPKIGSQMAP